MNEKEAQELLLKMTVEKSAFINANMNNWLSFKKADAEKKGLEMLPLTWSAEYLMSLIAELDSVQRMFAKSVQDAIAELKDESETNKTDIKEMQDGLFGEPSEHGESPAVGESDPVETDDGGPVDLGYTPRGFSA